MVSATPTSATPISRASKLPIALQVAMPEEAAPFIDADWRVFQLKEAEELLQVQFPAEIMKRGNPDQVARDEAGEPTVRWPKPLLEPAGVQCFPLDLDRTQSPWGKPLEPKNGADQPIIAISGVGLINATYTSTILAHRLGAEAVISGGTAGGLAVATSVGQIVAGDKYQLHQADATVFGYELGQLPGMPVSYAADQKWLQLAKDLASELDWPVFSVGSIVSGDTFVTAANANQVRQSYPEALATEMESAAIAQTTWLAGGRTNPSELPYLSLRCISDLCSPDGDEVFHMNVDLAAAISAAFIGEMLLRVDY